MTLHFDLSTVEQQYGGAERQRHIAHLPATYAIAVRAYEHLLTSFSASATYARGVTMGCNGGRELTLSKW